VQKKPELQSLFAAQDVLQDVASAQTKLPAHAAVLVPHVLPLQVGVVSCPFVQAAPGHWLGCVQPTHWPLPSQTIPLLLAHVVPAVEGVRVQQPPPHVLSKQVGGVLVQSEAMVQLMPPSHTAPELDELELLDELALLELDDAELDDEDADEELDDEDADEELDELAEEDDEEDEDVDAPPLPAELEEDEDETVAAPPVLDEDTVEAPPVEGVPVEELVAPLAVPPVPDPPAPPAPGILERSTDAISSQPDASAVAAADARMTDATKLVRELIDS
jgi:hypothetical protein